MNNKTVTQDQLTCKKGLFYKKKSKTPFFGESLNNSENIKTYYEDGVPVVVERYRENGQLWVRQTYTDNNLLHILDKFYDIKKEPDDSRYLREEYYVDGSWIKDNYKDGKKHGECESYFDNGQLSKKSNYKDGELDGLWESFDESGQLLKKKTYKDGKRMGLWGLLGND